MHAERRQAGRDSAPTGIFSYHAPGWSPVVTADSDPLVLYVIGATYQTRLASLPSIVASSD